MRHLVENRTKFIVSCPDEYEREKCFVNIDVAATSIDVKKTVIYVKMRTFS